MQDLCKLFSILQLTKDQPISGFLIGGFKLGEAPSLAEHHYTCSMIGWLLSEKIKEAGGLVNQRKIILMLLIHDLNEIFGGDTSGPLNRKYPELRTYKNKLGERSVKILEEFLSGDSRNLFENLWQELSDEATDEAILTKIIDQMDHQFFMEYHNFHQKYNDGGNDYRPAFMQKNIFELADKLKDPKTKKVMEDFFTEFKQNFFNKGYQGMRILME